MQVAISFLCIDVIVLIKYLSGMLTHYASAFQTFLCYCTLIHSEFGCGTHFMKSKTYFSQTLQWELLIIRFWQNIKLARYTSVPWHTVWETLH